LMRKETERGPSFRFSDLIARAGTVTTEKAVDKGATRP
jgi:hypothetical protein